MREHTAVAARRAPTTLTAHGYRIALPAGWEGRIYRRTQPAIGYAPAAAASGQGGQGWSGETMLPIVHAANFALPATRGDYGSNAVEQMGPDAIFIALLEFGPECVGTALYAPQGMPGVTMSMFSPNAVQRRISGLTASQQFVTVGGRPLCVYVVLGTPRRPTVTAAQVTAFLAGVVVVNR